MPNALAVQFAAKSDAELLRLGSEYASLTDEVQALVREEFKRRDLEVPDAPENLRVGPESQEGVMVIRQYRDQAEALIARSLLDSAGISSFLCNENTIRNDWLISNLLGGIRLQVAASDVEAAEEVLSQPIPAHIAVEGEPDYDQPECPSCGSLDVNFNNFDAKVGATTILLLGFPLPISGQKDQWHCNRCGSNWVNDRSE